MSLSITVAMYLVTEGQNEALKYNIHTEQCDHVAT